jgi:hypothetical protein
MHRGTDVLHDGERRMVSPAVLLGIRKRKQKRAIMEDLGPMTLLTATSEPNRSSIDNSYMQSKQTTEESAMSIIEQPYALPPLTVTRTCTWTDT